MEHNPSEPHEIIWSYLHLLLIQIKEYLQNILFFNSGTQFTHLQNMEVILNDHLP